MEKIITGTLPHGFKFKEKLQKNFEMREVETAGELFDAEQDAGSVHNQLAFNGALAARQLIRIGDCEGPFTLQQIRTLKPTDFQELRIAQGKLEDDKNKGESAEKDSGDK